MRVLTVVRNHVPAVDTPSAIAANVMRLVSCAVTPSASSLSHSASSVSGNAANNESRNADHINAGSSSNPSRQSRHIDESAGGKSSFGFLPLREDVMRHALLVGLAESLRLKIEHRAIPSVARHELVVRSELHDLSVLEHADAIGEAHGRKPM